MRRRSGAVHCQTEEQLIQLAENQEIGLYYNQRPQFREVNTQNQWTIMSASNPASSIYENFYFNQEEFESKEQQKQLNRGIKYSENCVVDKQTIRFNVDICILTQKLDELIAIIVTKDSLLSLFISIKDAAKSSIDKYQAISTSPNSNVFSLETTNVESCKMEKDKQNHKMTPKNWLKTFKDDKMIELVIVKKHISISQSSEIGSKKITIIHRIFIINSKYSQNPLIKIYLQKSHYVIDARGSTFKPQKDIQNKVPSQSENRWHKQNLYKLFETKSILQKDCTIFNRGDFGENKGIYLEMTQFKSVFHKIEQQVLKIICRG